MSACRFWLVLGQVLFVLLAYTLLAAPGTQWRHAGPAAGERPRPPDSRAEVTRRLPFTPRALAQREGCLRRALGWVRLSPWRRPAS
jgi:hypothetical protein